MTQEAVPAMLFRGGTTKGVYFDKSVLPGDRAARELLLLRSFGSPDPKQIDGVGGSHSTASKAMLISAADDEGIDVEYLFAQVGVDKPVVDWGGNCGNLTFAVGPFAIESGLVDVNGDDESAQLVLRNENTGTVVDQQVPLDETGSPRYDGSLQDHGLPRPGAPIPTKFHNPAASVADAMFPTGNRIDTLDVPDVGTIDVSLVDISNPCVFARASDFGMTGSELPSEIDGNGPLLEQLESLRSAACATFGFVDHPSDATHQSPGIPKVAVVGEHQAYQTVDGVEVTDAEFDVLARIMSMQKAHHAYSVTGAMCTAAAAAIGGTIPAEYRSSTENEGAQRTDDGHSFHEITIGHPKGIMTIGVAIRGDEVPHIRVDRTARKLMDGNLFYISPSD